MAILILGVVAAVALGLRRFLAYLRETDTKYWTLRSQIDRFLPDGQKH